MVAANDGVAAVPKPVKYRSQKLRDSARGEQCLVRLPGCAHDPEQTILSHYRGSAGGKGGATKASDLAAAYACTYCDAVYDGQRPAPADWDRWMVELAWHEGHLRSLLRFHEKGLL